MVTQAIAALKQAVEDLDSDASWAKFEEQLSIVRERLCKLKDAVAADTDYQNKNYQDLLAELDKRLLAYVWFEKNISDIITCLDRLKADLDALPELSEAVVPKHKSVETTERLAAFAKISKEHATASLDYTVSTWQPELLGAKDSIRDIFKRERIGELEDGKTSFQSRPDGHDYQLTVKPTAGSLYSQPFTYYSCYDANTQHTTTTVKLPADCVSSATAEHHRQMAELTVLAELALLRTLYAEKTEVELKKLIQESPLVVLNPTRPENANDRAYCEALKTAYDKYGFQVTEPVVKATATSTSTPPPPPPPPPSFTSSSSAGHSFSAAVSCEPIDHGLGSAGHGSHPAYSLDHDFSASIELHTDSRI